MENLNQITYLCLFGHLDLRLSNKKKFLARGGKLIFPLPIFHIIDKYNYKHFLDEDLNSFGYNI